MKLQFLCGRQWKERHGPTTPSTCRIRLREGATLRLLARLAAEATRSTGFLRWHAERIRSRCASSSKSSFRLYRAQQRTWFWSLIIIRRTILTMFAATWITLSSRSFSSQLIVPRSTAASTCGQFSKDSSPKTFPSSKGTTTRQNSIMRLAWSSTRLGLNCDLLFLMPMRRA